MFYIVELYRLLTGLKYARSPLLIIIFTDNHKTLRASLSLRHCIWVQPDPLQFIPSEALERELASGFQAVGLGGKNKKLKHVQSLRRQVFMFLTHHHKCWTCHSELNMKTVTTRCTPVQAALNALNAGM